MATLIPPSTIQPTCIATDASGQIYIAGLVGSNYEVMIFAAGAAGVPTPIRTINLGSLPSSQPQSMAVDSSGLLYIASSTGITVYSATATGTATPLRSILGSSTQLTAVECIAVDASGNIYVTNQATGTTTIPGMIFVFSATATGNVAPTRSITYATAPFYGIAVDTSGNIYTVADTTITVNGTFVGTSASILEYAAGASGAATPLKTIAGPATALGYGGGMRIDSAGNLYLINAVISSFYYGTATFDVLGFGPTATGNEPPAVNFSSTAWSNAGSQLALH